MRTKLSKFALTAALMLALTFTLSCSGDDGDDGGSTFKDSRDGTTYKTKKIGNQTWMAGNLNYDVPSNDTDVCYDNDPAYCKKYGRLYNWETAIKACPNGWRLPSKEEWNVLIEAVGGEETAGKYLKSKSGWNEGGNGEDKYGFSALPGGFGSSNGYFSYVGDNGIWWSSSEYLSNLAYHQNMYASREHVIYEYSLKHALYSVRCLKDWDTRR